MLFLLIRVNLSVITVFAGNNVADTGMLGVMLEVSVMLRNMWAVPVIISAMVRGNVKGFAAVHRIGTWLSSAVWSVAAWPRTSGLWQHGQKWRKSHTISDVVRRVSVFPVCVCACVCARIFKYSPLFHGRKAARSANIPVTAEISVLTVCTASVFSSHKVFVSYSCHNQHLLFPQTALTDWAIGYYRREEVCSLRGTNWLLI